MRYIKSFADAANDHDITADEVIFEFKVGDSTFAYNVGSYRLHPTAGSYCGYDVFTALGITNAARYIHENFYNIESTSREAEAEGRINAFPEAVRGFHNHKDKFLLMLQWLYGLIDAHNNRNAIKGCAVKATVSAQSAPNDPSLPLMNAITTPSLSINF